MDKKTDYLPITYLIKFQDGVRDAVVLGKKADEVVNSADWQKGPPQGYSHGFAFGLGICDEIDNLQEEG